MIRSSRHWVEAAICLTILAQSGLAPADVSLTSFEVAQVTTVQSSRAFVATGEVSWNPTYNFTEAFAVRSDLGVSVLKNVAAEDSEDTPRYFPTLSAELLLSASFAAIFAEAGGGVSVWLDGKSTRVPSLSANVGWAPHKPLIGLIDRLFVGFTMLRFDSETTRALKIGSGIRF